MRVVNQENRLPSGYKARLLKAEITHAQVAARRRQLGHRCSRVFVTQVINGIEACPQDLRNLLDKMLKEK